MTNRERLLRKMRIETAILNQTLDELADEHIAVYVCASDFSRSVDKVKRYTVTTREFPPEDKP